MVMLRGLYYPTQLPAEQTIGSIGALTLPFQNMITNAQINTVKTIF